MLSLARLESILDSLPRLTIGLVGDLFLDRYLDIEPGICEMSIETGLEAYQIPRIRNSPGALGTVLNNLAALGVGLLVPATVIGDDGHGYDLLKEVRKLPVDASHVLAVSDRLTGPVGLMPNFNDRFSTKRINIFIVLISALMMLIVLNLPFTVLAFIQSSIASPNSFPA